MRTYLAQTLAVSTLLGLLSFSAAQANDARVVEPELSGKATFGKLAYDRFCSSCHGTNGAGTNQGPPFLHRYYLPGHHGDRAFQSAVTNGVRAHHWNFGDMPPIDGVSDQYVQMIVEYVRALQRANGFQ